HIVGNRRLEAQGLAGLWVGKREPIGMKRLPSEVDRPKVLGTIDVPLLAHERVASQPRLKPDLIALARFQAYFYERRAAKPLDDFVPADGVLPARIARMRLLLDERTRIPHEPILPGARRRIGMSVDHRSIDARHGLPLELVLERRLRGSVPGEDDQPGR